jgi:predicted peptidase
MTGLSIVMLILTGCAQAQVQLGPTTTTPIPATSTITSLPTPTPAPTATPTSTRPTFTPASSVIPVAEAGQQVAQVFELEVEGSNGQPARLNYLLFLPKDYGLDPQQRWPLILFLHGLGERGSDPEILKKYGIPKVVEQQPDFPFIVVSPQCSPTRCSEYVGWHNEIDALIALLDEIVTSYAVDTEHLYLTGLSMGGFGAWELGIAYPEQFAAIVPIAGGGNPQQVCALKDVPVWAFHGAKDNVVPPSESERMVKVLKECGGNIQFTLYPDAEHDSWTQTYDNPELYKWLLQQTRR